MSKKHRQVRKKVFPHIPHLFSNLYVYLACDHDITPIVFLEISLERVDFATRSLLVQDAKIT